MRDKYTSYFLHFSLRKSWSSCLNRGRVSFHVYTKKQCKGKTAFWRKWQWNCVRLFHRSDVGSGHFFHSFYGICGSCEAFSLCGIDQCMMRHPFVMRMWHLYLTMFVKL